MCGADNPFSARHLRPGAVPFLFTPGYNPEQLVARLEQTAWRGQVIGPHGSGKSTLLAALMPALRRTGRDVRAIALHDGQRRLPAEFRTVLDRASSAIVVIDGYEQLSFWNCWRLWRTCHRRRLGLLVTAHRPVGLPDLYHTGVDPALAWQVVQQLQAGHRPLVTSEDVQDRLVLHAGNLREALFDLYDLYEQRR